MLQEVGDNGTSVARLISGVAGVGACVPRNTSYPASNGDCGLAGQLRVVVGGTAERLCDTDSWMSMVSPENTRTDWLFEPVAVAVEVQVVSMLQRTCTR